MNNHFLTTIPLLASSTLFVSACSDDSPFIDPDTTAAANNEVQTQIPDQDSLTLSIEKIAVEALSFNGETVTVTAYVADRNNNPVPDNTAINFLTNGGSVEPRCLTTDGVCSVIWTEQDPTPGVGEAVGNYEAIIIAYTVGEESFVDSLNDNGLYDLGEQFTDISEPFFDINDDGVRDESLGSPEIFVDADGDKIFDTADGLFTGTPCVGDNTVCNRTSTLIWDRQDIVLSSSGATITHFSGVFPLAAKTSATFIFDITDIHGKYMADGTNVRVTSDGGTVTPAAISLANGQTRITVKYTTADPVVSNDITIEVETPSGLITYGTI